MRCPPGSPCRGHVRVPTLGRTRPPAAHRGDPLPATAAFLYPPGPWRAGWTSLDISAVLLDLPAAEVFAQQLTGRRFRLVPTGTAPRSAAMLQHWTRVEAWFRRTLLPDPVELLEAAERLVDDGFVVRQGSGEVVDDEGAPGVSAAGDDPEAGRQRADA